jgi:hypothetical protein
VFLHRSTPKGASNPNEELTKARHERDHNYAKHCHKNLDGSGTAMNDIAPSNANDRSSMNDRLVSIWERVLQRSPIPHHANFFDLGVDSCLPSLCSSGSNGK